ncbi:MAG TPA: DUF6687 family protein [Terriglobia bacterium]|nr:DUF6687 family protein [Terriglobia bacterium]
MRYVAYDQAVVPNIVVDGSPNGQTLLTLSHWPRSGTPAVLKADTSAEIAFKYLDTASFHVACDVVTNNHFDQDGLVGLFILIDPQTASRHRELLIDVASAGDFGVFKSRTAARINFAVSSFAEPETSPFPKAIFEQSYPSMAAELYQRMLGQLPLLLTDTEAFKTLWEGEDAALSASEEMVEKGTVTIEELLELDLAVVHVPENLAESRIHRFARSQRSVCHPLAIHNRTPSTRILLLQGQHVEFQYRYEGWVQLVSRKPLPRVDLSALAGEFNQLESGGRWIFDGVDAITPRLHLEDKHQTSIPPDVIRRKLENHLRAAPPAWDPYDSQ